MPLYQNNQNDLTGFTTSTSTVSPNNTVNVARLLANTVSTDGDIVLSPKGIGSILAQLPDGTATGGNKRGVKSLDFSVRRDTASQVASGSNSINLAPGGTASGTFSINFAPFGVASGTQSINLGSSGTASGDNSINLSSYGISSGQYSTCLGYQGDTKSIYGKAVFSGGAFTATGDCQVGFQILRGVVADTAPKILTANNSTASTTNQIQLQNNQSIKVKCDVLARSSTGLTKNIEIVAVLKRGASASTTTVSTPIVTTILQDSGTENWTMALSADTTNGCGAITFTVDSAINVRCMAKIETIELTY